MLKVQTPTLPNASSFGSNGKSTIERTYAEEFSKGTKPAALAQLRHAGALGRSCYGGIE